MVVCEQHPLTYYDCLPSVLYAQGRDVSHLGKPAMSRSSCCGLRQSRRQLRARLQVGTGDSVDQLLWQCRRVPRQSVYVAVDIQQI